MAEATNFLEEALLNHLFRTTAYTAPSTIYVALFTAAPGETGGGTEVTGGSYARVGVTTVDANWSDPSAGTQGETDNVAAITFPAATANWGTVTHVALFDAATSGNMLMYSALDSSVIVNSSDTFEFAAGALNIQLA